MKASLTYIKLKSPLKFFTLSFNGMKIVRQLKTTNCINVKNTGFWKKHYTMTLWNNEQDIKDFYKSGAHLEAMKISNKIAQEIRTITIDADSLPDWKTAKNILRSVKPVRY